MSGSKRTTPLFSILLIATATSAPAAIRSEEKVVGEVLADKALVYFIRTGSAIGSGRTYFIYSDGVFVGTLDNSSYTFAHLEPGDHFIVVGVLGKLDGPVPKTKAGQIRQMVEVEAGKTYYFRAYGKLPNLGQEKGEELRNKVKSYVTPSEAELDKGPRYRARAAPKKSKS